MALAVVRSPSTPRDALIVDGAYVQFAAPDRLDWLRYLTFLEDHLGNVPQERYFLSSVGSSMSPGQESFYRYLQSAAPYGPRMRVQLYGLKSSRIRCPACGHDHDRLVQKGVDVGLCTLLIKGAVEDRYDRAILFAGDGDFEDAIAYVRNDLRKDVIVTGFPGSVSPDLQSWADEVLWLDGQAWDAIKLQ